MWHWLLLKHIIHIHRLKCTHTCRYKSIYTSYLVFICLFETSSAKLSCTRVSKKHITYTKELMFSSICLFVGFIRRITQKLKAFHIKLRLRLHKHLVIQQIFFALSFKGAIKATLNSNFQQRYHQNN